MLGANGMRPTEYLHILLYVYIAYIIIILLIIVKKKFYFQISVHIDTSYFYSTFSIFNP